MTDNTSGVGLARISTPLGRNALTRIRNLALQGLAELAAPQASSLPRSEDYVELGEDGARLRRAGRPEVAEVSAETLGALAARSGQRPIDLVFTGTSCIDITFTLPAALLPELRRMVETEIGFRSPFANGASLSFWQAEELTDGYWRIRAAVALKAQVTALLDALAASGLRPGVVRREVAGASFVAQPGWAGGTDAAPGPVAVIARLPVTLRLTLAGAAILLASAAALSVSLGLAGARLGAEAEAARSALSAEAQASAGIRSLDVALARSAARLALTGVLSELLPDGTWLDQLVIEGDTLTLAGFGPSAAEVTRLLSTLPELTEIAFASPVTRDNTQSLERFRIVATMTGPSP